VPAATGVFRDMTGIRFEHPEWIAENCTACGNCYTECPDSPSPAWSARSATCFNTAINRIETGGTPTRYLRRAVRPLEKKLRALVDNEGRLRPPAHRPRHGCHLAETPEAERAGLAEEFTQLQIRSAASSSPPPSPTGATARRSRRAAAACSRSPSIPTPARAARCA
jgi:pyruvate-ferredoxin/flavodoxin oxidoreductase